MDQPLREILRIVQAHPEDTDSRVQLFRMARRAGIKLGNSIIIKALELWELDIGRSLIHAFNSIQTRLRKDPESLSSNHDTFEHFYTHWGDNYEQITGAAVADPESDYGEAAEHYFRTFQSGYANSTWRAVLARLDYDFQIPIRVAYLWDSEVFHGDRYVHRADILGSLRGKYGAEPADWRRQDPNIILKASNTLITNQIPENFEPLFGEFPEFFCINLDLPLEIPQEPNESASECYSCHYGNPCIAHTRTAFRIGVRARRTMTSTRIYLESFEALRQTDLRRIGLMVLEIGYPFN